MVVGYFQWNRSRIGKEKGRDCGGIVNPRRRSLGLDGRATAF